MRLVGRIALALMVVLAIAYPLSRVYSQQQITLTYASFGGALRKAEEQAWLRPYEKANPGIQVLYDNVDYAKLIAQVTSGNVSWDVVQTGSDFGLGETVKYLEKIDCSIVPCADLQPKLYKTTGYRVGNTSSGTVLGYNKTKMPPGKVPQNWADFFNLDKFPGKRVMMGDLESNALEIALVADGVDPRKLYPLDLDRALKKLGTIKSNATFTTNYQQCAELVATGEAVMGQCWSGRFFNVIDNGAPVAVEFNQETLTGGYLLIPKGTKNLKEAMKFVAYLVSPEVDARLSDFIPYGPANVKGLALVKESVKPRLGTTYQDRAIFPDDEYWGENRAKVDAVWQKWLTTK